MSVREKILIVDDNPTNIEILQEYLQDDYELEVANSGEEALVKAAVFQPAIMLLDIMMPGMDGYETCRRIRASSELAHIKIIILSVKAMLSERLEGYTAGADDYITKPFEEEELLAKVRVYLRLKSIEEMNELNSNLLALLSHETRTPLTSILMPIEMLMSNNEMDAGQRTALLRIIFDSTKSLQRLFDKIFLLNTLKTGTSNLQFAPTDLCKLARLAIDKLIMQARERNILIDAQLPDTPLEATVDGPRLQQVLESILDNAIRFSPDAAQVSLNLVREGEQAVFSITDHGEGIDGQFLPQLFKEFTCADVDHHSGGHGLSLAIAKQILRYHQGSIAATSDPQTGTVFTVHLPLTGSAAGGS
ncbi:MAG: hybrid sensor histidine kinase/response regulator [Gammaproteobacteria bacterium]|nr:hybrid sensor histidine kinase/response regulator [Gammaproteobacteria bacterium]MCP5459579.1 hybrid sensor histidine kinase/response regulator [Gammaproteobacteria bacterium]